MIDTGNFETAFIIFAATLAVLVAVGVGLIVSTVRREREETRTGESTAGTGHTSGERTRELVS